MSGKVIMKFFKVISFFVLSSFILSCSITAEGKYSDILEKYAEGEIEDTAAITENLLEGFSSVMLNGENIFLSKNVVITGDEGNIILVYPEEINLNAEKIISDNISYADMGRKRIMLGNSKGFCVFNPDGDPVAVYRADKKENIDSAVLRGDNTVFFTSGRINELSDSEKTVNRLDQGVYSPPYKKLFRASMISSEKYYGVITGIAGAYYISVFDNIDGTNKVKNIAASSFEFNMKDDYVLYIRGGTGVWSLVRYDIPVKKRNKLKTLGKISDVYVAEEGLVYISENRTYVQSMNGERWEAPAMFRVKGICRNSVLADYKGKTYIIDFNVLYEKIQEFGQVKGGKNG